VILVAHTWMVLDPTHTPPHTRTPWLLVVVNNIALLVQFLVLDHILCRAALVSITRTHTPLVLVVGSLWFVF